MLRSGEVQTCLLDAGVVKAWHTHNVALLIGIAG